VLSTAVLKKYLTYVLPIDTLKIIVILSTYNRGLHVKWLIKTFYSYIIPHHIPGSIHILWQSGHHHMQKCQFTQWKQSNSFKKRSTYANTGNTLCTKNQLLSYKQMNFSPSPAFFPVFRTSLCFQWKNYTSLLCSNIWQTDCKTVKTSILNFHPL